jgi:PKD repeat protein
MVALTGTKMAAVFGGVGVAVGIIVTLIVIGGQNQGAVFARVVEDNENPFTDPEFLKTYQTSLRTGAHYKAQVAVGQEAFFAADAKGGKLPYTFEWKFSDGVVLTEQNATRTFETAGTHRFDLTVTDAGGQKAGSTQMSIRVTE